MDIKKNNLNHNHCSSYQKYFVNNCFNFQLDFSFSDFFCFLLFLHVYFVIHNILCKLCVIFHTNIIYFICFDILCILYIVHRLCSMYIFRSLFEFITISKNIKNILTHFLPIRKISPCFTILMLLFHLKLLIFFTILIFDPSRFVKYCVLLI